MAQIFVLIIVVAAMGIAGCSRVETNSNFQPSPTQVPRPTSIPSPTSAIPNLQAELLDERNTSSTSPIAKFDFKNYTYGLPRGWQNPDGTAEITLKDGRVELVGANTNTSSNAKGKDNKEKEVDQASFRRIGLSLVAIKFFDVTGDGEDEAVVILKIETGGSAIPQIVHVFSWKDGRPELIWPFRTGDRSDGGLKNIYATGGNVAVELFGQDRFLLGEVETGRISDDLEQICCPTHFTRTVYKWNGKDFLMQGKRLTFTTADPSARPLENYGDTLNNPSKVKK